MTEGLYFVVKKCSFAGIAVLIGKFMELAMLFLKNSLFLSQGLKGRFLRCFNALASVHCGRFFYISIFILFLFLFLIQAWIVDDARMTFRQVVNFVEGYGIVWNFGERLQTFTHPLWFFVLSAVHFLSFGFIWEDNIVISSVLTNLFFCICALWIYLRGVRGLQIGVVLIFLLILFSSHAFMVYTSSGLENALSYFLVAACCYLLFFGRPSLLFFFLCAGLFLNRADYAFMLLPMSLYVWRLSGYRLSLILLPIGVCFLWLLFSTWYFGFPFPNTSIVKLNIDAPLSNFIEQGLRYYKLTLLRDPVTLFVIFSVMVFSFYEIFRNRCFTKTNSIGLGLLLYGLYILWIGGDFLQGRFFSVPFFYGLCGLSFYLKSKRFLISSSKNNSTNDLLNFRKFVLSIILLSFIFSFVSILHKATDLGEGLVSGISNERPEARRSLTRQLRDVESFSGNQPSSVEVACCTGLIGLHSTGDTYIVSYLLGSPYLSRITGVWGRIGHMAHPLPADFEAWVIGATPHLPDPAIDAYFSDIREVVRGDLFSLSRMKKIVSINFQDYKLPMVFVLAEQRFSHFYPSLQKQVSLLSMKEVDQESWQDGSVRWFSEKVVQSLSIDFTRRKISKVSLPVRGFYGYSWSLYDGAKEVYKASYASDSHVSFQTHELPNVLWADRLEVIIDGGSHIARRMGRPILK